MKRTFDGRLKSSVPNADRTQVLQWLDNRGGEASAQQTTQQTTEQIIQQKLDAIVCSKCGSASEDSEVMYFCDCCSDGFHASCLGVPAPSEDPDEEWFCSDDCLFMYRMADIMCQCAAQHLGQPFTDLPFNTDASAAVLRADEIHGCKVSPPQSDGQRQWGALYNKTFARPLDAGMAKELMSQMGAVVSSDWVYNNQGKCRLWVDGVLKDWHDFTVDHALLECVEGFLDDGHEEHRQNFFEGCEADDCAKWLSMQPGCKEDRERFSDGQRDLGEDVLELRAARPYVRGSLRRYATCSKQRCNRKKAQSALKQTVVKEEQQQKPQHCTEPTSPQQHRLKCPEQHCLECPEQHRKRQHCEQQHCPDCSKCPEQCPEQHCPDDCPACAKYKTLAAGTPLRPLVLVLLVACDLGRGPGGLTVDRLRSCLVSKPSDDQHDDQHHLRSLLLRYRTPWALADHLRLHLEASGVEDALEKAESHLAELQFSENRLVELSDAHLLSERSHVPALPSGVRESAQLLRRRPDLLGRLPAEDALRALPAARAILDTCPAGTFSFDGHRFVSMHDLHEYFLSTTRGAHEGGARGPSSATQCALCGALCGEEATPDLWASLRDAAQRQDFVEAARVIKEIDRHGSRHDRCHDRCCGDCTEGLTTFWKSLASYMMWYETSTAGPLSPSSLQQDVGYRGV